MIRPDDITPEERAKDKAEEHPAAKSLADAIALSEKLWDRAQANPPTHFSGFTQRVIAETHYMADGSIEEVGLPLLPIDKFARIIHPKAFEGDNPADQSYREHAMEKARKIMTLVNEIIADSPAYKQWANRGFPK